MNYLSLNPISSVNGIDIEDQIIWHDHVINLLVPVSLRHEEERIKAFYLQHFYNGSIAWFNRENERLGVDLLTYTMDDLTVNMIYVDDDQYYFSFNSRVRSGAGNLIRDPIAIVHTDNFHPIHMMMLISGDAFHFVSTTTNPLEELLFIGESYDLQDVLRFTQSVFSEHAQRMRLLERDIMSGLFALFLLILSNVIISYNLISNYFWQNKHTLFTKSLFGFSRLQRHKWFVISILIYAMPVIFIMSAFLSWRVFTITMFFLLTDFILFSFFENRLMKKSFAEIMKGVR